MGDLETFGVGDPTLLWLLVVPAVLLVLVGRSFALHRRDRRRLLAARLVPVRERFSWSGGSLFWGCLALATALLVLALARPHLVTGSVSRAGVDLVVLLDGSASMHVRDTDGSRWQRSVRFLRVLGDTLRWEQDRVALTLFAHIAAPQIRLTRDPNTFFFFLDNLADRPPFRLEDDTSWDTNIALGIEWGLRLVRRDVELRGPSPNTRQFVLVTDGQAWSGTVAEALRLARAQDVPVSVVGVGTLQGGTIPDPKQATAIRSSLDRESLRAIAATGGGRYLELDRAGDAAIAAEIVDMARRRAVSTPPEPAEQAVYWPLLAAAAALVAAGSLALRDTTEVWLQLAGAAAGLALLTLLVG